MGSGTYETWVETLRKLSRGEPISLENLPLLRDDSFSPSTFVRLTKHLNATFEIMQNEWSRSFQDSLKYATNDADFTRALVRARKELAKQVDLANCNSLPPSLKAAYSRQITEYVEELQRQIEYSGSNEYLSKLDLQGRDHWLRMVRKSPLTAVLNQ